MHKHIITFTYRKILSNQLSIDGYFNLMIRIDQALSYATYLTVCWLFDLSVEKHYTRVICI